MTGALAASRLPRHLGWYVLRHGVSGVGGTLHGVVPVTQEKIWEETLGGVEKKADTVTSGQ